MIRQAITHIAQDEFVLATPGRGLSNITDRVAAIVRGTGLQTGLVQVFTHHTSCSLLLGENADPTVCDDLERFFDRLVPDGDPIFRHTAEGPDDMPAHVRSVLTGVHLAIPLSNGGLDLGTWQGVFLYEHRHRAHQRRVSVSVLGGTGKG